MSSENNENYPKSPVKSEKSENFSSIDDKACWSPTFEFDAPRYTNFSSKKFSETRRLLNKIVLNQEDNTAEEEEEKDEGNNDDSTNSRINFISMDIVVENEDEDEFVSFNIEDYVDESSDEIDEWFNRFHPLHEPLLPQSPPGPLISPERSGFKPQSLRASPLKLDFSNDSPAKRKQQPDFSAANNSPIKSASSFTPTADLNTPSKGPNTRIGLRSKPARILKPANANGSSINSSPSSLIRSNFSDRISETRPKSPQNITNYSPKSSIHSSPTKSRLSNASSVALSISSLTKTFYNNNSTNTANPLNLRSYNSSPLTSPTKTISLNVPSSPLKMKTKFSEGIASPLRTAVGILQLDLSKESLNDDQNETDNDDVLISDKIPRKRPKTIEETVNNNISNNNNNNNNLIKKPVTRAKPRIDAELEDIKKLLSQHNSRIRPNNNTMNKRKS